MKEGVKQDAKVAAVWLVMFTVYVAVGALAGLIPYGHVSDMILTNWVLYGLGGFFLAAILYHGMTHARLPDEAAATHQERVKDSYVSGKFVAIIAVVGALIVAGLVAHAVLSDH